MLSNSFAGIAPTSVPSFVVAEALGGALAFVVVKVLYPGVTPAEAADVVVAHHQTEDSVSAKPVVLFLCVHNAGRSLAARVLLDHYAGGRVEVRSAGSEPGAATQSVGRCPPDGARNSQPGKEFPKPLTDELAQEADVIVTMGCGDTCPVYPGKRYLDWELDDPAGQPIDAVRPIVEEIDRLTRISRRISCDETPSER